MTEKTAFQQRQELTAALIEKARALYPFSCPITIAIEEREEVLNEAKGKLHRAIRDAESAAMDVASCEASLAILRKAAEAIGGPADGEIEDTSP